MDSRLEFVGFPSDYISMKNCLSESILKNYLLGARIIRIFLEPKDTPSQKKRLNPFAVGHSQFKPSYLFTFMKSKVYLGPVQSGFLIWEWELNAMS